MVHAPRVADRHEFRDAESARLWNWLLQRQGLATGTKFSSVTPLADTTLGLHSARLPSPFATVLARASADVALSLFADQIHTETTTIRCMRKTLHLLTLPLAAAAHGATLHFRERDALRSITNAGVSMQAISSAIDAIVKLLACGPLSHREIEIQLHTRKRPVFVIRLSLKLAWERGLITYFNDASCWNHEYRKFDLTNRRHPDLDMGLDRDKATGELVRTYFDRYGPASLRDAVWWSGLSQGTVMTAMAESAREWVAVQTPWSHSPLYMYRDRLEEFQETMLADPVIGLNFLAHEDVALKAYFETRARYLGHFPANRAFNQIGEVLPTITWDGRIVGTWAWDSSKKTASCFIARGLSTLRQRQEIRQRAITLSEALRLGWSKAPARRGTETQPTLPL